MIQPLNPKHHGFVTLQRHWRRSFGSLSTQDTCNGSLGGSQVRFPPNSLPPRGIDPPTVRRVVGRWWFFKLGAKRKKRGQVRFVNSLGRLFVFEGYLPEDLLIQQTILYNKNGMKSLNLNIGVY